MKRWLKLGLWCLGALAALLVAALIVVQTGWFREKVRQRIVAEIENATGGRVELAAFDFQWRRLSAEVRGLVIHGTEGPGEQPLFRARSIAVGLKVVSVFQRRIDIQSLVVDTPEAHLIVYPDGSTNLPAPKLRRPRRDPIETILDLAVKRFSIVNGAVRAGLRKVPLSVAGEDLRAQIAYEAARPRYRGEIAFQRMVVTPSSGKSLPLEVEVKLALEKNRLEVGSFRVASRGSRLEASGELRDFVSPRAEFEYAASVAMEDVAPARGLGPLRPRGTVKMEGKGSFERAAGYRLSGRLRAGGLAIQQRGVRVENISAAADVEFNPEKLELRNLVVSALRGRIAGQAQVRGFRELQVTADVTGFALDELTRLPAVQQVAWSGTLSGPVRLAGVFRQGGLADLEAEARLTIAPAPGPNPLEGSIEASYSGRTGRLELGASRVATPSTSVQFTGALGQRLEVELRTTRLTDFEPAWALVSEKPPPPLPVRLDNGAASFRGVVTGPLADPQFRGRVTVSNLVFEGRSVEGLEGAVTLSKDLVRLEDLVLRKGQMRLSGTVEAGLRNWSAEPEQPVSASLALRARDLAELAAEAGQKLPLAGDLSAAVTVSGVVGEPRGTARITVLKGVAFEQPFDRLEVQAGYSAGVLEIPSAALQLGPGRVELAAALRHRERDFQRGDLRFDLSVKDLSLGQVHAVEERSPGLEGRLEGRLSGNLAVAFPDVRVSSLNGQLRVRELGVEKTPLGSLLLTAATGGRTLSLNVTGMLAGSPLHGASQCSLEGQYPAQGTVQFERLNFTALSARLGRQEQRREPPFDGYVSGRIAFSGSALEPPTWRAAIDLPAVELVPRVDAAQLAPGTDLSVRNRGPIRVDVGWTGAVVRQAELRGQGIEASGSGTVAFRVKAPWDLRFKAALDLAMLRALDPELASSGRLLLDATLRGPLEKPELYGRAEIQDGSLYMAGLPNGLDKINAVALLYRDRATLERFSAESGGGKVAASGFVGFGTPATYSVETRAEQVRYRDPTGVSVTANAELSLTGTMARSVLGGEVTITRISFHPQTDLGSLLAASAQPAPPPSRPGMFTQGIRFDVRVRTSPQARLETALTRGLQAEADLRLRGDPGRPALLGRVLVNQGEVLFFGNQYTIDSGEVTFTNPVRIEPTVKLDLQTKVRGVDVTLTLSGPVSKLNVTYRSDPPLQLADIVGLLATGREPASAPGLVGARTAQSQSWEQAGATALMSQAITSPLAGRLQRFFGVSRLKIDPTISGTTGTPEARVTLEQQLSPSLTFTYISNLTRAQEQAMRVEWGFTRDWSVVALREENGLFGVDFLYKKRFK